MCLTGMYCRDVGRVEELLTVCAGGPYVCKKK